MELETLGTNGESFAVLTEGVAQLTAAAAQLERAAAAMEARFTAGSGSPGGEVARVVATVETDPSPRLAEMEIKLRAAEQQIAELRAQAVAPAAADRKTLPAVASHLLAKHGGDGIEPLHGEAIDAALNGLSLEQRIAVKSQLMRAGLLG